MNIEISDKEEILRHQNFIMMVYTIRVFFLFFILSWFIEVIRLSSNDHMDYMTALNNPPDGCLITETDQGWYLIYKKMILPIKWLYTTVFEPPIKQDCMDYFRKINPMTLYLPRIPQALGIVAANFFLTPFIIFIDKFGDSLRHFMDKFNIAERLFGVILLLAFMVLSTAMFISIMWTGKSLIKNQNQDKTNLLNVDKKLIK